MLSAEQIHSLLEEMEKDLIKYENRREILLSREWINGFLRNPGTYVAFEDREIVYIGETGDIRGRMGDLRDTRNHSLRRNIGKYNFSRVDGYSDASTHVKFPPHIEEKVNSWLKEKVKISILITDIGRKELEERLVEKYTPKYNQKGKRKSG